MRIWRLSNPLDYEYAQATLEGTWVPSERTGLCPECTAAIPHRERKPPLIIEWQPDSDVVGDFVWAGLGGHCAVKANVLDELCSRFSGFVPSPVEMIQDPKLKRPKRITKRTKSRIWLPYEGIPLYELWVTVCTGIDNQKSSLVIEKTCSTCGLVFRKLQGVEVHKSRWNKEQMKLEPVHIPRVPAKGIFVHEAELNGADIFRVKELGSILCTDSVKDFIGERGFTNVRFLEYGNVI